MARQATSGKCRLCGHIFKGNNMSTHLRTCLKKSPLPGGKKAVTQKLYHVAVKGSYAPDYWMHLLVPTALKLTDLDSFLRDIWLECCGHLSAFQIGDTYYNTEGEPDPWMEQESADVPIWKVLKGGDEFGYEYDFGTTTKLSLKVVGELTATGPKNKILLIARNAAEQYKCKKCGKPAEYICNECVWDQKDPFYCEACLEEHGCEEGMSLPITNSPRMGECGYCGETDKDEDAYKTPAAG